MPTALDELAQRIAVLEAALPELSRSSRLAYSSVDDGALTVTAAGTVRAIIGQQPDGTTAVNVVNGPPPPTPATPAATGALGGVAVTWDGTFADGAVCPLDFARVEVHAARTADVAGDATTLISTIESPQGGRVLVPTAVPVTVVLVARSTSGRASSLSATATASPSKVVADQVLAGIVGELQLADAAVTAAKVAAAAIDSPALADAAVTAAKIGQAAVAAGKLASDAVTAGTIAADAVTAREIAAGTVTTAELAAGAVTTTQLAAGAVTAGQIAAGAITATQLAANAVTSSKIAADAVAAGQIAAGAITGREIKALSISGDKLAANTITAGQIAAGAITTDALAVGVVNNFVPDGGFEGPVGAALVAAAGTGWAIAAAGNGSVKSARVDASAATATTKSMGLVTVAVRPGDQLLLRCDYQASSDWKGSAVKFYAKWMDATGSVLGYGAAQTLTPALGPTWQPLSATVTAPANTATARLMLETLQSTAGSVLFDNAEAKPVLGQVQIADGTITAAKLSADAITGKTITGGTISGTYINGVNIDGATLRTAAAGNRVEITSASGSPGATGMVRLYSGSPTEVGPAAVSSSYDSTANTSRLTLMSAALTDAPAKPAKGGVVAMSVPTAWPQSSITLSSSPGKSQISFEATDTYVGGTLGIRYGISAGYLDLSATSAPVTPTQGGVLSVSNPAFSHVIIGNNEIVAAAGQDWTDLVLNKKLAVNQAAITASVPISAAGWQAWQSITYANGTSQLGGWQTVGFKKMADGTCMLRGIISVPGAFANGVVGTIGDPTCRPKLGEVFAASVPNNVGGNVFVQANGNIEIWNASGALGGWLSFSGIRWSCVD
ncbi:hypothetical protein AB0D10_01120 [Kitasatospora sp. NPDC048545]|uniref:hypothetical protein n=1 Tax=Kitasatospora sp. NPDC048545 TaxID=3157208 RepID=UPI0033D836AB